MKREVHILVKGVKWKYIGLKCKLLSLFSPKVCSISPTLLLWLCAVIQSGPHNFQHLYTYTLFYIHIDDSYKKWVISFDGKSMIRVAIHVILTKGGRFSLCLLLDSDLHYFLILLPNLSVFKFFSFKSCSYPSCGFKYCPNADELWLYIFCSNFASEFHVILTSSSPEIATWWWTQLLLTKMKVLRLERWFPG